MGLFSTEKQVFVDSVVYNLAGPPDQRPNYLKNALMSAVMSPSNPSVGESITRALLKGPGINLRSFSDWAENQGYNDLVGMTPGEFNLPAAIDTTALAGAIETELPVAVDESVILQSASIGVVNYTYWVHQYVLVNHPDLLETAYEADYDPDTGDITITYIDTSTETFTPADYDINARYLYAMYTIVKEDEVKPLVPGTPTTVGSPAGFPSTAGWTLISSVSVPGVSLNEVYERDTYQGWSPTYLGNWLLRETMYQDSDFITPTYTYQIDTNDVVIQASSKMQVLIYKKDSGTAVYDAFFQASNSLGLFLPYIPLRIDNQMLSPSFNGDIYEASKKALRRAGGASYIEILDKVQENPNLADIDYAYVAFGVALNAQENSCRRYIYEFFQEAMLGEDLSGGSYSAWVVAQNAAQAAEDAWQAWADDQILMGPLYNTAPPARMDFPERPTYDIRIRSGDHPTINYDMSIVWNGIMETTGSGILDGDYGPGDLWWEVLPRDNINNHLSIIIDGSEGGTGEPYPSVNDYDNPNVRLHWQVDANSWRTLEFWGLMHLNHVYKGNYVIIPADDAIEDPDETGFIIPINDYVMRKIPLRHSTQLSVSCYYIIFNCYKVVKQKWYETGWFKVVLMVVIVVVAMATGYIDPNAVGLVGANAAVGAAAGFTGTAAAMAGAVINALVASMVTQILGLITTAVAGPKYGAIISVAIMFIFMGFSATGGFENFGQNLMTSLMDVRNLIKLTLSAVNVYKDIVTGDTQSILEKTQKVMLEYNVQAEEISKKLEDLVGPANVFNPLELAEISGPAFGEPPSMFLERTLLTGSDISAITHDLITNYAQINTNTNLPT